MDGYVDGEILSRHLLKLSTLSRCDSTKATRWKPYLSTKKKGTGNRLNSSSGSIGPFKFQRGYATIPFKYVILQWIISNNVLNEMHHGSERSRNVMFNNQALNLGNL